MDLRAIYVGLPLIAAIIFFVLALLTLERLESPGARTFIYLSISLIVWSVGAALETYGPDLASAGFWARTRRLRGAHR